MSIQRKNDSTPNNRFFEASESQDMLEEVRNWLLKNQKKVDHSFCLITKQAVANESISTKQLSSLLTQIMSFQEERFGKHANTHQFVKLPVLLAPFCYPFRLDFSVISNQMEGHVIFWRLLFVFATRKIG